MKDGLIPILLFHRGALPLLLESRGQKRFLAMQYLCLPLVLHDLCLVHAGRGIRDYWGYRSGRMAGQSLYTSASDIIDPLQEVLHKRNDLPSILLYLWLLTDE